MFVTDILFQTEENVLAHESAQNMGFHWRYFYVVERYFRKILKNSEIFLTADEKGGKIGNIKKESRKRNE